MSNHHPWISPTLVQALQGTLQGRSLVCLVDGEHYPPVTGQAVQQLEELGAAVDALVFIGGTEKVENAREQVAEAAPTADIYCAGEGFEDCLDEMCRALREGHGEAVIDLSDEPVVSYEERFRIASRALAEDVPYAGADFLLTPPPAEDVLRKPGLSVIGTGKRVGKTAVGASIGRILDRGGMDPVVLCMGRGGPPDPHYVNPREMTLDADALLDIAEEGGHAASDYWEEALLSRVPTIGCRRCGGGMAGTPVTSNVIEGARMAEQGEHRLVVLEGSGATFAPVRTDRRIAVVGAGQPAEHVVGYLGRYRLLTSDLAIVTMCEKPTASPAKVRDLEERILDIKPDIEVALTVFRPQPLAPVEGREVFVATCAPRRVTERIVRNLEDEHECRVRGYTSHLSDRDVLGEDLKGLLSSCDLLLTEIKAASIDVAARAAKDKGVDVGFLHNQPVLVGGTVDDLDESILGLCREAEGEAG